MRSVLLEPTASVLGLSTFGAHNILEPLGLEYLASCVSAAGHHCDVIQQRCEERGAIVEEILSAKPDLLGISTQAYNIDDALWFAREIRNQRPDIVTVFGGYHASACPELVCDEAVDYVILGEGETTFLALLEALSERRVADEIPGLAVCRDGKCRINERPPRISSLDEIPFPRRQSRILEQCRMHGLMVPPPSRQRYVAMVTATRGCPYNCTFCCSELIWRGIHRRRSPDNVVAELVSLVEDYDVDSVFFCDLTFNANKKYTIELCDRIAREGLPLTFYAMCNVRGIDDDIAGAMKAAGCAKIGFGIESFTEAVRSLVKDGGGMSVEETNGILDVVSKAGILVKTYFIIGFPWETEESLAGLGDDLGALRSDEIKVTFYVPFPGTRGFEDHAHLITPGPWSRFTTLNEPIVHNGNVGKGRLIEIRKELFWRFYRGKVWRDRVVRRLAEFPEFADSFAEFQGFLLENGIVAGAVGPDIQGARAGTLSCGHG